MKSCLWVMFLALPVILGGIVMHIMILADFAYFQDGAVRFDKLERLNNTIPGKNCQKYLSNLPGEYASEDVVRYSDNILVFPSGDNHKIYLYGWKSAKNNGHIFIVDLIKGRTLAAEWVGWPENRPFFPHGTYFSKITHRYYVINHSGLEKEHSVVEIFDVVGKDNDYPSFHYRGSIKAGFENFVTNDLVENGEDEIFITQFRPHGIPEGGDTARKSFWGYLNDAKYILSQLIGSERFGMTGFHLCKFDIDNLEKQAECIQANEDFGYVMINGITVDRTKKEKNTIYVVDLILNNIHVYAVPKKFNVPSLQQKDLVLNQIKHIGSISSPDSLDNIEFDDEKQVITGGGIPSKFRFLQFMMDQKTLVPGSMIEIDAKTWKVERKFYHDGSVLNELSSCVYNSDKSSNKAVCGSPFNPGVLVCSL